MIIQGCYSEVEFSGDGLAPYFTSDVARRLARRLTDAADRADGRLPDGVYRVSFPDSPDGVVTYRRVVAGKPLNDLGGVYLAADSIIILERVGDIPGEGA